MFVEQHVNTVEWRHIFGMCFDDNGVLSLEEELAIFEKIQARIREKYPFFNLKLIACGLKVLGPPHIKK